VAAHPAVGARTTVGGEPASARRCQWRSSHPWWFVGEEEKRKREKWWAVAAGRREGEISRGRMENDGRPSDASTSVSKHFPFRNGFTQCTKKIMKSHLRRNHRFLKCSCQRSSSLEEKVKSGEKKIKQLFLINPP
jgi:hypothetical protein